MKKRDELSNPRSCFSKAAADEPIFVLRAKDPLAAQTVRLWASMADWQHEPEKIAEALRLADEMEEYRTALLNPPQAAQVARDLPEGDQ